jgi:hypothetical protein
MWGDFRFALLVPRSKAVRSAALASESGSLVPSLALSRSEVVLMMQRLAYGGIPSFFAAPRSPSSMLKRLQSVRSALCRGFQPTGAPC